MSTDRARGRSAGVYLEPADMPALRVGTITRSAGGETAFTVDQAYADLAYGSRGPTRPILGCRWIDVTDEAKTLARLRDASDKTMRGGRLPAWFEGLLPEGTLRELVDRQLGTGRHDDFDVICHLGADLPGAVVVRPEDTLSSRAVPHGRVAAPEGAGLASADQPAPSVRFSLAGVQLKFWQCLSLNREPAP